jgi:hypothetical protein
METYRKGLDTMYIIFYIMFGFLVTPFSRFGTKNSDSGEGEALSPGRA